LKRVSSAPSHRKTDPDAATTSQRNHAEEYRGIFRSTTQRVPRDGFSRDFWELLGGLLEAVVPLLEVSERQAVILCADDAPCGERKLAQEILQHLTTAGTKVILGRDSAIASPATDDGDEVVLVPLLSAAFLRCERCVESLVHGGQEGHQLLPVLAHCKDFRVGLLCRDREAFPLARNFPFLQSVLNRANSIPPCRDFDLKAEVDMHVFLSAFHELCSKELTAEVQLAQNSSKLRTLIQAIEVTPIPSTGSLEEQYPAAIATLREVLAEAVMSLLSPATALKVLLCGVEDDSAMAWRLQRDLHVAAEIEVGGAGMEDPVEWCALCEACDVCIVLLSQACTASHGLQGRLTFAKDLRRMIIPVILQTVIN